MGDRAEASLSRDGEAICFTTEWADPAIGL
jgi:hypothetical protein